LGSISIRTVWLCTAARKCAGLGSAGVPPAVPRASRPRFLCIKWGRGASTTAAGTAALRKPALRNQYMIVLVK
jgi:hypothetical protein